MILVPPDVLDSRENEWTRMGRVEATLGPLPCDSDPRETRMASRAPSWSLWGQIGESDPPTLPRAHPFSPEGVTLN